MASLVVGIPIDEAYMRKLPDYKCKPCITQADMAEVAREQEDDEGMKTMGKKSLEGLKQQYGGAKSAMCMVYNATGADLTFVLSHNWNGHIFEKPYPVLIKNGQWGAWLHVPYCGTIGGSSAAVVYRGKNCHGKPKDWLHSWEIQHMLGNNMAHTEVRNAGHYAKAHWPHLHKLLTPVKSSDVRDGCLSEAIMDLGNLYTGVMSTFIPNE